MNHYDCLNLNNQCFVNRVSLDLYAINYSTYNDIKSVFTQLVPLCFNQGIQYYYVLFAVIWICNNEDV